MEQLSSAECDEMLGVRSAANGKDRQMPSSDLFSERGHGSLRDFFKDTDQVLTDEIKTEYFSELDQFNLF